MPESNRGFSAYVKRDLLLAYRRRGEVASPIIFFVMVATLIPLGITPEADSLKELAPGIIWVMALLATLLSAEGLFVSDYKDGSLEQLLISPNLLVMPIFGKVTAHWITTGLPLTLASPLIGLMLSLPVQKISNLFMSMLKEPASRGVLPVPSRMGSFHCRFYPVSQ